MNPIIVIFLAATAGLVASQTTTGCQSGYNVCKLPCSNGIGSCPAGTSRGVQVLNGFTLCNCARPYTDDELKELGDAGECAFYISQCLANKNNVASCKSVAGRPCSTYDMVDMCELAVENGKTWVYDTCASFLPEDVINRMGKLREYIESNSPAVQEVLKPAGQTLDQVLNG